MLLPGVIATGSEGYRTVKLDLLECTRCSVTVDELSLVSVADMVCELPTLTWPNCKVEGLDASGEAWAKPQVAANARTPTSAMKTDFEVKWGRFIAISVSG